MRILVIDDEKIILADTVRMVENVAKSFYQNEEIIIDKTHDAAVAVELINQNKYDMVFSDIDMPKFSGLELAKHIEANSPNSKLVFVTGYPKYSLDAWATNADGLLLKPINQADIARAFAKILPVKQ